MGSPAIAALVAQVAFWALLLVGFWTGELSARAGGAVLLLWLCPFFGDAYRPYWLPFSSCVAILDVALVLMVAKGDVWVS
jgi:hypothetical protein